MEDLTRWFTGVICLAIFLPFFLMTIGSHLINIISRRQKSSYIPVIGMIFGIPGFLLIPNETVNSLFWIPIVIDPFVVVPVVELPHSMIRERRERRGENEEE